MRIDSAMPLVECDAVLIERVWVNLLENVGKYTPCTSPVEILVRPMAAEMQVCVRDHSPGVPQGKEDLIFEKFTLGQHRIRHAPHGAGVG